MTLSNDLVNQGFIVNRSTSEEGRTFIVTGLERSGTSLIAAILREAGIFMGSEINDSVLEDEQIATALDAGDCAKLRQIIGTRNASHIRWGFKYPALWQPLSAEQMDLFDKARLIVTFRDPVAMAVRTSLSEYQAPMRALRSVIGDQMALMEFVGQLACPNFLLSYEKALTFPKDLIDAIGQFCDVPIDGSLRKRLIALVEPNRPQYLQTARRPFEGLVEGVSDGRLYGWCWLMRVPEPVTLDILVDDRLALSTVADSFRQDLADAGIGQGRHGWFVPLERLHARPDSVVRVRVTRFGVELANSGRRLCDFGSAAA